MRKVFLLFAVLMVLATFSFSQIFEKQGAGVTIIVHGWNPDGSQPDWMLEMANAIIARNDSVGHIATITVTGTEGSLSTSLSNWTFDLANQNHAEIIVLVNWTAVSNHLTTGIAAQEVAAAVAPMIYESQNSEISLAALPIHLVGHSRGGGMVFELARLLGLQGVEVEHVTALDPHPLTSADPQSTNPLIGETIDTPISVSENILFADCYYQNIEYPEGEYITGAYNRLWTSLSGGYHNETGYTYNILGTNYNFSDHLNIILAYHGTIDLTTPTTNGEATMTQAERNAWFIAYENAGENTGFKYSRQIMGNRKSTDIPIGGGDAIIAGFHNDALLGGQGPRTAISWGSAYYPNVLTVDATLNGNALNFGSTNIFYLNDIVQLNTTYRTNQNSATIIADFDTDRNPYNFNSTFLNDVNFDSTGSTITQQSLNFDLTGDLVIGAKYYLLVEITDEGEQRFMYAPYELEYGGSIDVSVTGITKPVKNFGNTVVKANIYNNGDVAITDDFDITYICNGDTITETFTANIDVDATVEYAFTQTVDLSNTNIYTIKVFTDLQHDNDATNDTLSTQINTYVNSNTLAFDGVNDYVGITEETAFDFNAAPFTVETWFKITVDKQGNIVSKHTNISGTRSGYCIEYNTGLIKAIIGNGPGWTVISDSVNLNQAYHLAMTYNSDTLRMYLDGVLIGTTTGTMLYNDRNLWIGGSQTYASNYFGGNIDEVRFWNTVRTQQQIQDNMHIEIDPQSANLMAYYNFNRGISVGNNTTIDTVGDITSNNFHGALVNFNLTNGDTSSNFIADCDFDFIAPDAPVLDTIFAACSIDLTTPNINDNCAGIITGTTSDSTSYSTLGTYTVTWNFDDGNGHIIIAQQVVVVNDWTAPVADSATLPDIFAECEVTSLSAPTATDNCTGTITGTHNATLPINTQGTTVVTWTYNDGNGNASTQTQNVIINDVTAPVPNETTLADITAECEVTSLTAPTATDNCTGTITGTHNATLPINTQGTTIVTWTYNDGNGNASTQTQNVIINDVTAPVPDETTLADITAECEVTSLTAPTATDNCTDTITGTHNATLPITTQGTTVVTWTYNDGNGNASTQTQNVIIDDVTNPTISCITNQVVDADSSHTYIVRGTEFDPTATYDNCGVISVINDFNSSSTLAGAQLPEDTTITIVWTITDSEGNMNTCSCQIMVNKYNNIQNISPTTVNIYPNPANEFVIIKTNIKTKYTISLHDNQGRALISLISAQLENIIDIHNILPGIYLLKIIAKNASYTYKIYKMQ